MNTKRMFVVFLTLISVSAFARGPKPSRGRPAPIDLTINAEKPGTAIAEPHIVNGVIAAPWSETDIKGEEAKALWFTMAKIKGKKGPKRNNGFVTIYKVLRAKNGLTQVVCKNIKHTVKNSEEITCTYYKSRDEKTEVPVLALPFSRE